jgi:heme ABC exporter ATP-binding subunit CcmA
MSRAVLLRDAVALVGRFPALAGADLTVDRGEVVVLAGPNGAGKTSLLRVCAGLLALSRGEAVVLGRDLRGDASSVRRHVGMLGHAVALYDDLTVAENARFFVRASGASEVRVGQALERFGLVGRLARTPAGRLSAGQRRRVALAVLAARRPELWLLDEPHAGLDAGARSLLAETVGEAAAEGSSVLLASHELAVSVPLAHRVAQMAGGRVVDVSPAARAVTESVPGAAGGRGPQADCGKVPGAALEVLSSPPPPVSDRGGAHVA